MIDRIAHLNELLAGRYVVQRELGAGGMATVYLAEDLKHHRRVAIKVLRDDLAASVGVARFLREIEIAAQLQHPNVLPLLDSGEASGLLYYVMPFVEGQSLRQRLNREHELPIGDAVKLLVELVDALSHAHEHGVVHRDIKPDNIMLSGRHALVTDFGVARAVTEATGGTVTTLGIALGTPAYMSPEQATAAPDIDHRADIYAVGVVAYELLAGRLPFGGGTPQQVLAAHVTETPEPVFKHRPAIHPQLAHAVMRCLAKRPADRWQSAAELLAVLEPLATPSGGTAPTEARIPAVTAARRGRRAWWIGGGVAIAGAAIVPVVKMSGSPSPSLVIGRATQLTNDPGLQIDPALSPDGKLVAYAAGTSANMRIFIRSVSGGRTIPLTDDSAAVEYEPRWSPDGSAVLFLVGGGVSVAPALGGKVRRVIGGGDSVRTASWSPDGREIVFARNDSLFVSSADGQRTRFVATNASRQGLSSCRWSPTGRVIACVSGNLTARVPRASFGNKAPSRIVIAPAAGGSFTELTDPLVVSQSPEWSSTDDRLYFVSNHDGPLDVYELVIGRNGTARGQPRRVTTGLNARSVSVVASTGRLAYDVYTERANVFAAPIPSGASVTPVTAAAAQPVTEGAQVVEVARPSADGKWLVFDSSRDGTSAIYRIPIAGGSAELLTHWPFDVFAPDLSPDGRLLAYHSFRNGTRDIEVLPLDGGQVELVTNSPSQESYPVWSRDGRRLAYFDQGGRGDVVVRDRLGAGKWGPPAIIWHSPRIKGVDWSPDGQFMVANTDTTVVVLSLEPGPARTVYTKPRGGAPLERPVWSTDGKTIYFKTHDPQGRAAISAIPSNGGAARVVLSLTDLTRPSYRQEFALDAHRFYFPIQDRQSNVWVAELRR